MNPEPTLSVLRFAAVHFAGMSAVALVALLLGAACLWWLELSSWTERVGMSLAAGLAGGSVLLFTLGAIGLLEPLPIGITLGAGALLGVPVWRRWSHSAPSPRSAPSTRALLLFVLSAPIALWITSPVWISALYPPTQWDGISYHLAAAKAFVAHGALVPVPHLRFPLFPQLGELWFAVAMLWQDDVTAQLTQFLAYLGCGVLVFHWARREDGVRAASWATALWLASPLAILLAGSGYIDVLLAFFVLAAAYAMQRSVQTGATTWMTVAGGLAGAAVGTKYSGLPLAVLLLCGFAVQSRGARLGRGIVAFAAAGAVTGGIWLARNAVLAGDPLFPFLPELFGYSYWSAADLAQQRAELRSHGIGHGPLEFLRYWFDLAWNQGLFRGESLSSLALVIPMPILFALRWRHPRARLFAWLCIPFATLLFFQSQLLRYLLPVLPFLCLETAALLESTLSMAPVLRRMPVRFAVGAVLVAAVTWTGIDYAKQDLVALRGPLPTDGEARRAYLLRRVPPFGAIDHLNRTKGPDYRLYALHAERGAYFADGEFLGDWFGPARVSLVKPHLDDGAKLDAALRELGADHLLLTNREGEIEAPRDSVFLARYRLIFEDTLGVRLYERMPSSGDP